MKSHHSRVLEAVWSVKSEPVLFKPATLSVFTVIEAMQTYKNILDLIKQTNKK